MLESLEIYQYGNGAKMGPFTPAEEALMQENIVEFKKLKHLTININDTADCDSQHLQFILNRPPHIFQNVRTHWCYRPPEVTKISTKSLIFC